MLSPEESTDDRREDNRNEDDELQGKESGLSVEENSRSTIQVRSPFRIPSASSRSREHLARYSRKRKRCKGRLESVRRIDSTSRTLHLLDEEPDAGQ